jgi:alpha-ketoglutarate-dependent taurine dioxygenase
MKNHESMKAPAKPIRPGSWKDFSPKLISVSPEDLIESGRFTDGQTLPLVIRPKIEGIDLFTWAAKHLDFIESTLLEQGGILFRGFDISSGARMERFANAIRLPMMHYVEGATPRTELGNKIYTSTEYPPDESIALHNELNYVLTWPMKIIFGCSVSPQHGGETPIADVRRVLKRIGPRILDRFRRRGWMLMRNFGGGVSLPWQVAYRLDKEWELEAYCKRARIEYEWTGGERLRTRQVRPAIRTHPRTGEPVWFNHIAFWHVSSLRPAVREIFQNEFAEEDLPYNTYYGDGIPIEDEIVAEIRQAYDAETVTFPWEKGDLLLMDNMLVAHGRKPFGGERKILVMMGEPYSDSDQWQWDKDNDRPLLFVPDAKR